MPKFIGCLPQAQGLDDRSVCNATESHHHGIGRQLRELIGKKSVAGIDLGPDRLVVRRQALHRVRYAAINQPQVIVSSVGMVMRAEAMLMQHLIEHDPRMVAGKRTSGTIRAVHSRGKTYDQEAGVWRAKGRYWLAVIVRVALAYVIEKSG